MKRIKKNTLCKSKIWLLVKILIIVKLKFDYLNIQFLVSKYDTVIHHNIPMSANIISFSLDFLHIRNSWRADKLPRSPECFPIIMNVVLRSTTVMEILLLSAWLKVWGFLHLKDFVILCRK